MPPDPVCLSCRRPLEDEPAAPLPRSEDVEVTLDIADAARELAQTATREERDGLRALGLCPTCGRAR